MTGSVHDGETLGMRAAAFWRTKTPFEVPSFPNEDVYFM
jgi:hypothetical protein